MGEYENKLEILRKYKNKIKSYTYPVWVGDEIPKDKLKKAISVFAMNVKEDEVLAFYDTTMTRSGKSGSVFTLTKWVYRWVSSKPEIIYYDEIEAMSVEDGEKPNSEFADNTILKIKMIDGKEIIVKEYCYNKRALVLMLTELMGKKRNGSNTVNSESKDENVIRTDVSFDSATVSAGLTAGHVDVVNKSFDEEKYHAAQGHGFAAEQANDFIDAMTGHKISASLGDDFAKHGADRSVDGILIQSKYCKTGYQCIEACFKDGQYIYVKDGVLMQVEVPNDQTIYESALKSMRNRIETGQVPGVTDPDEAENLVRRGHVTYKQAVNLAKAGTVESLIYDASKGMVSGSAAFGITTICTFAQSIWNGDDFDVALNGAISSGLKVGGTVLLNTVLTSQLLKAGLNSTLVGGTEAFASMVGSDTSAFLVNAFRETGKDIYGIAAQKSFAKIMRGNIVSAGVTIAILTTFDVNNLFKGKISGKQLFKNLVNTSSTVVGGIGGFVAGQAMIPIPVVGGLVGSAIVGGAAGKASNSVMKNFVEDDAVEMIEIVKEEFGIYADDYLLSKREGEKAVDKLQSILNASKLKDMFASEDRHLFAREMLEPIFESIVTKRQFIKLPSGEDIEKGFIKLLSDDNDDISSDENVDTEEKSIRSEKDIARMARFLLAGPKPSEKLIKEMKIPDEEEIVSGIDCSTGGNGKNGFVFTTKAVYTKAFMDKQIYSVSYGNLFKKELEWKDSEHHIILCDYEPILYSVKDAQFYYERISRLIDFINGEDICLLKKDDFDITAQESFQFIDKYENRTAYFTFVEGDYFKTKRGISFPAKADVVQKKYGAGSEFKVDLKSDKIYKLGEKRNSQDNASLEKAEYGLAYYYGGAEINFYFDSSNKLVLVGFYTNGGQVNKDADIYMENKQEVVDKRESDNKPVSKKEKQKGQSASLKEKINMYPEWLQGKNIKNACMAYVTKFGYSNNFGCEIENKGKMETFFVSVAKLRKGFIIDAKTEIYLGHDDTLFKNGKNGFVITSKGVYCKELLGNTTFTSFENLRKIKSLSWNSGSLYGDGIILAYVSTISQPEKDALEILFKYIIQSTI